MFKSIFNIIGSALPIIGRLLTGDEEKAPMQGPMTFKESIVHNAKLKSKQPRVPNIDDINKNKNRLTLELRQLEQNIRKRTAPDSKVNITISTKNGSFVESCEQIKTNGNRVPLGMNMEGAG